MCYPESLDVEVSLTKRPVNLVGRQAASCSEQWSDKAASGEFTSPDFYAAVGADKEGLNMLVGVRLFGFLAEFTPADSRVELPEGSRVEDALRKMGVPELETVLVLDGKPAGPDTVLFDGSALQIFPLVAGG